MSGQRMTAGADDERPTTGVDHERFWRVLDRFAGTLVDRFEVDDVLEALGTDIRDVLGVAGAGVMLGDDHGNLRFTSTSDGVLHELEGLQIELGEGPCLLAYRTAEVVIAADLRDDERFREFGPQAVDAGMAAVYSFPMHMEGDVFGALNLYSREPGEFTDDQVEVGRTFADVATSYLANARDSEQQELLTKQLQQALNSRVVIEQAKGYVVALTGLELQNVVRAHQIVCTRTPDEGTGHRSRAPPRRSDDRRPA
jgi:GAF domain-containing protein